jgi:hypothetical protein
MEEELDNRELVDMIRKYEKSYRKEALNRCNTCWDGLPQEACTQACSQSYHIYRHGIRMLTGRYRTCIKDCNNSSSCQKQCQQEGINNINSLNNFIDRMKKLEESTEALLNKS